MSRPGGAGRPRIRHSVASALLAVALAGVVQTPVAAAQADPWWQSAWRMPEAWQLTDGSGTTVALIDSGVDASISELDGAVVPGTDYVAGGDGTVDRSDDGHGTGMASLIASRGGASGLVGVAPGATILPIAINGGSVPGRGNSIQEISDGIRHAVDNGADVINLSLGGQTFLSDRLCPEAVAAAVRYALSQDVVIVSTSGNDPDGEAGFPGSCPGVLTVGAVDRNLEPWSDSHRSEHVDVAAPGIGIPAVIPGGETVVVDGTSNSTALVTGVVALVRAQFPEASAYQVVARVLATAEDIGTPGRDDATGYGLVRPYHALTEPVASDAPNPVFDAAGDLTDTEPPPEAGEGYVPPPSAPVYQPPLAARPDNQAPVLLMLGLAGGLALLLAVLATVVIVLLVRSRRRRRHSPAFPPPPVPPRWQG